SSDFRSKKVRASFSNCDKMIGKKIIAVLLIVLGLLALFTPFTPGSWLVFIGAELLGIRLLSQKRLHTWWNRLRG
ncbi:MAG: hypothetical protein AAB375_02685, partial [Patescibacteria group bacterium]